MIFQDSELNKLSRLFNQIINETYGLERESLDALSFIPPQAGIGQWLRTWTYKVLSEMGIAKLISDYAEDLPPVSRALELKTNEIREYGVSYGYSEFELMQWLTAGIDLSRDEAETARRKIDEKVDEVLFVGDKDANTTGFLNNANVPMRCCLSATRTRTPRASSTTPTCRWSSFLPELAAEPPSGARPCSKS